MKRATLISFDGISGSGKDVYISLIRKELEKRNKKVVVIEENRLDPIRKNILSLLNLRGTKEFDLFASSLFNAGRKYVYEKYVNRFLKKDIIILLNRTYISTMAQQSLHGLDPRKIKEANTKLGIPKPDLRFLLYCTAETAFRRVRKRGETHVLGSKFTRTLDDFRKTISQYVKVGKMEKCKFINTEEDINTVNKKISSIMLKHLK